MKLKLKYFIVYNQVTKSLNSKKLKLQESKRIRGGRQGLNNYMSTVWGTCADFQLGLKYKPIASEILTQLIRCKRAKKIC